MRIVAGGCLLAKHGWEKALDFHTMATSTGRHFPDPIHIGVVPSLTIALISAFVCGLLIMMGLGTRPAAAFAFLDVLVAWITEHHF